MKKTIVYGNKGESAEVTMKSRWQKYGKDWQYFDILDGGRRENTIAIDRNTGKLVRGKASPHFVNLVVAEFMS